MVEAHINSKRPKYQVTAQATSTSVANALVRSYTWGLDASGSMQGAGGVGGLLMVNAGSGGVHFPAYDLNGNVMGLVNATNGNISAKYEYGPFGEVFCSVGDMAKVNPFGFSTKYTDNETDLVYYGYRYYSPALGRWLSRDPIEEKGGLNLYGFVNNDPVNNFDLDGKEMGWNICPGCRRRFIDRGSLQFKCPYCGWPPPDEQYPEGFSLCQRDIQKDGCCDVLGILGDFVGGEHTYVQYINNEGKKWGYGFGNSGVVPENAFNPNHCKKCKRTNRTLRFGGSAGKSGNEATDEEIKDCIKKYPNRKTYKWFSLWNRYNCKDWAKESVLNCGLNCN